MKAELLRKTDDIIDRWTQEVSCSIKHNHETAITYESIRSRLPLIIEAVAASLANERVEALLDVLPSSSWKRLYIQVELGFDIEEMSREFGILRVVLVSALRLNFSTNNASPATLALHQIDAVLNLITTDAVKRYDQYQAERLKIIHRELLSSNQELVRLVQMQKDNASHLAHELKNPLNAVLSFSSLLLRSRAMTSSDVTVAAKEIKQLECIYENGRQMLQLVNNMLEASRQESHQLVMKVGQFEVAKLVEKVVESQRPSALDKGLTLTTNCQSAPPMVKTDGLRLQQVLINLVSNAIRYTDAGSIQVSCTVLDNDYWMLSVQDTGRGISLDQQTHIFRPYTRADATVSYPVDSDGLGLAIVTKLVKLLQGKLKLTSTVGKGSTFSVVLPLDISEDCLL